MFSPFEAALRQVLFCLCFLVFSLELLILRVSFYVHFFYKGPDHLLPLVLFRYIHYCGLKVNFLNFSLSAQGQPFLLSAMLVLVPLFFLILSSLF